MNRMRQQSVKKTIQMTGKELKNSILQLAISGKLVPQDPTDEPASVLLKRLFNRKKELVSNHLILKKADTKPFFSSDEIEEMSIPNNWEWVQLSDVSVIQEGAGIRKWQYRDSGTQVLCVTNILEGKVDLTNKYLYISKEEFEEKYTHLRVNKGDIVTSCSGGSWGKTAIFDLEEEIMLNTSTLRLRFFDDIAYTPFLYYISKSSFFKKQLEDQLSGMQPNFGYAHYSRIMIPLPPLAEQRRIVAKIEELMPLIDEYDKAQAELDKLNTTLPEALKKSILQQAICGKLVPQDPTDEPASELLKRIRKEKEQLVKQGKLKKKDLDTTPITDDEKPFDIPDSWQWCRLKEFIKIIGGTSYSKGDVCKSGLRILRGGNIQNNQLILADDDVYLPLNYCDDEKNIQNGDIIIVASTGSLTAIGKPALIKGVFPHVQIGAFLRIIRPSNFECWDYIGTLFRGSYYRDYLTSKVKGTNINNIKTEYIEDMLIPLPPLAEQHRIVAKIEQLFALIDK